MNIFKNAIKALPPIKKVLQQRDDYRNQAEQLCNNLNKLKLKNEEMRIEVERLNERLHFTKKELQESAIENNKLTAQLQEIVAENRSLTIYNTEAEQKLTQLNGHNAALAEENAVLRQRNEVLQKQLIIHNNIHSVSNSAQFWEKIYANQGNSGTGSYKHLAEFKAEVVNTFLCEHNIFSTLELGCGDGNQLSLINYRQYTGVDVSQTIVEQNRHRFQADNTKRFFCSPMERELYIHDHYDLAISMDVIFHLLEDSVFAAYMEDLFQSSSKYVVIYSSNHEEYTIWPEYRHRKFMKYIQENIKGWKLFSFIPNKYPYVIGEEETTSAADFYFFKKIY